MSDSIETTRPIGPELKKLLGKYDTQVQELLKGSRRLVLQVIPKAEEVLDHAAGLVGYGFGARYSDFVCTLILSKQGVKLGFIRGAELDDPGQLLAGNGKVHKHVALQNQTDLERPELRRLLERAFVAWQERQA